MEKELSVKLFILLQQESTVISCYLKDFQFTMF